jgi:hypothetical protein
MVAADLQAKAGLVHGLRLEIQKAGRAMTPPEESNKSEVLTSFCPGLRLVLVI